MITPEMHNPTTVQTTNAEGIAMVLADLFSKYCTNLHIHQIKLAIKQLDLAYLFISHDLSVVRLVADELAVMYLGQIVETGAAAELLRSPLHPYTRSLLAAVPDPHRRSRVTVLSGEVPTNIEPPSGCPFHIRCAEKMPECETRAPALHAVSGVHPVACFLHHDRVR